MSAYSLTKTRFKEGVWEGLLAADSGAPTPEITVDFDGRPCEPRGMAPAAGEQTDEILAELGYGPEEVAKRRQAGWVS